MRHPPRPLLTALCDTIIRTLTRGRSVALVGPTDSGKTHFATRVLGPALARRGLRCAYAATPTTLRHATLPMDVYIVDEVELLEDARFLHRLAGTRAPYHSATYLDRVRTAHAWLRRIAVPCVYIVTRNAPAAIAHLTASRPQPPWVRPFPVAWYAFPPRRRRRRRAAHLTRP